MILAAVDLGTVTSRMLVGKVTDGKVQVLKRSIEITNMGEGLADSGVISDSALARVSGALLKFKEDLLDLGQWGRGWCPKLGPAINAGTEVTSTGAEATRVGTGSLPHSPTTHPSAPALNPSAPALVAGPIPLSHPTSCPIPVYAVATSAMRDANNSRQVLAELADIGFDVQIIAGQREAELSFLGTLSGFELPDQRQVMSIDVGGGSTEVILGSKAGAPNQAGTNVLIQQAHSFDIGSRRVTEMFLHSDPPLSVELTSAQDWINAQIQDYFNQLPAKPQKIYAVAGTATSAISVRDSIDPYDSNLVHGAKLTCSQIQNLLNYLAELPLAQRAKTIGLQPGRAAVIVGGLLTLLCMLQYSGLDSLTVSETDILEGIILSNQQCNAI